ncbi:MAG: hypothetical protein AAB655_00925 [Patescibacteria group bacterium]
MTFFKSRWLPYVIAVPIFAFLFFLFFYPNWNGKVKIQDGNIKNLLNYANSDFRVSLLYPPSWLPDTKKGGFNGNTLSFTGDDGFFGIDAISGSEGASIDDVVSNTVLNLYGSDPTISSTTLGGMEARLIIPSEDQSPERRSEAAVIARYPGPVKIGDYIYVFFMLYGDKNHLPDIAQTVQFVGF